ncbi:hypothetical protein [Listeria fleischmannii]|nr:hypothetical protein [Listeria fleischmannii]
MIRNWKGADTVYPSRYIVSTLEEAEQLVLESEWDNVSLKK